MMTRAGLTSTAVVGDAMGRLVPSPLVRSALHGDRTILLDLRCERYYGLDEVGTRVWAMLKEEADVPAIVARLGQEYDAPRERLQADVSEILRHLTGLKVIIPVGTQPNSADSAARAHGVVSLVRPGPPRAPSGVSCALALASATLALRVLGLRRSLALIRRLCRRPPTAESPSAEFLAGVARKVDTAAAFFPGRALCLEQSFALYLCLRRAGVPAELRLGVQPYPFAAHAWVEYGGEPVGESWDRVGNFVPFGDLEVS